VGAGQQAGASSMSRNFWSYFIAVIITLIVLSFILRGYEIFSATVEEFHF
jgi:hypothetical protein